MNYLNDPVDEDGYDQAYAQGYKDGKEKVVEEIIHTFRQPYLPELIVKRDVIQILIEEYLSKKEEKK